MANPGVWSGRGTTLLRVAGGVESIILGDVQLLGQLRTAYATAQAQQTMGQLLNRLCQAALHAGRRARAETGIATGAPSMAAAAVQFATTHVGGMARRRVLIVGGGQIGRAIAAALSRQRCEWVTVATRDPEAFAAAGGSRHACAVRSDTAIPALLSQADAVSPRGHRATAILQPHLFEPAARPTADGDPRFRAPLQSRGRRAGAERHAAAVGPVHHGARKAFASTVCTPTSPGGARADAVRTTHFEGRPRQHSPRARQCLASERRTRRVRQRPSQMRSIGFARASFSSPSARTTIPAALRYARVAGSTFP
jgi:threonine dehydrogenase-like Zn-dependent dehydrogenase